MQKLIKILAIATVGILSFTNVGIHAETTKKQASTKSAPGNPAHNAPQMAEADNNEKIDAPAQDAAKPPPETKSVATDAKSRAIESKIKSLYPQVPIESIKPSAMKHWYELTSGPNIIYVSQDGRYLFAGELLDLSLPEPDRDLTENIRRDYRLKLLSGVDLKDAIVYPVKAGKAKTFIYAFVDPDCEFCKRLQADHDAIAAAGIELRYLAYPRAGVGSETYQHMVSAWCSDNRVEALDNLMKGNQIPTKSCTNPVADQFLLGQKMQLQGTPTLILENGTLLAGYVPVDKLVEIAIPNPKTKTVETAKTDTPKKAQQ